MENNNKIEDLSKNRCIATPPELSKSDKSRPRGQAVSNIYKNYYDIDDTIRIAQAINPNDQDNPNYNQERVFEALERNAELLHVSNDGSDILYVVTSHQGGQSSSRERPIYPGEIKKIFNVYELRLRSATVGLPYRVSEYSIRCCSALKNRQAFNAQSLIGIGAVGAGTQLPNLIIPVGLGLVIRATVGNNGTVYVATSAANTGIAANRITLAVGDAVKLLITNANIVWVAGSAAAQNVDLLVEQ